MTWTRNFPWTAAVLVGFGISLIGASVAESSGRMVVEGAWTRATPPSAKTAVGYLILRNMGDSNDRLVRIDSPVAATIEVHSTTMDGGIMRMRRLDDPLTIPAGGEVRLDPGGLHLMMIGLKEPLREGGRVVVDLFFERSGKVVANLPIARLGATKPPQ